MNGVLAKVFTLFNQTGDDMNQACLAFEMTSFTTDNRGQTSTDGKIEYIPWSAECEDYVLYSDGIKRPSVFRAVWNYPDERFVYFDGKIDSVNDARVK